ncbi:hypothetical protein RchiOBHm_Chr1g0367511 [Rosa chinensis]|uniref:DUF668 domain-containing protein n=1 Tax=Rosa chinensis TaxID=74649 RepID=A0A2P6SKI7_ROSCH|nr:hypothetical protein RchiOBHm_Chr1g0367511 [Rosa chinensis]
MLPANMRAELSERLPSIKSSTSSVRDLAAERKVPMAEILEWLAPLAHNTTKWQSKRNFQQKASCASGTNPLLCKSTEDRSNNYGTSCWFAVHLPI